MVEALLSAGANPLLENEENNGCKAIHYAACSDDTVLVNKLLSTAPTTLNARDKNGFTPLHAAASKGSGNAVSFLLSAGASDVGIPTAKNPSALLLAVGRGNENMVRILLEEASEAVGGLPAIRDAVFLAVCLNSVAVLGILLNFQSNTCGGLAPELLCESDLGTNLHRSAWASFTSPPLVAPTALHTSSSRLVRTNALSVPETNMRAT